MKKENRRLFMMHELVGGEGQLVIYELEKSRSIIPVEIHMFSPKTLSVKMMPKRTASSETGRTYFQIRVSEESALPSVPECVPRALRVAHLPSTACSCNRSMLTPPWAGLLQVRGAAHHRDGGRER